MTPTEIRQKAAELIEERGWTRGRYQQSGRICMVAALGLAAGVQPDHPKITPGGALSTALGELARELGAPNLIDWNDSRKRRQEVLAALRGQS